MAVDDYHRLCEVKLCIHGTISASKLIFDSRDKQENICSQLPNNLQVHQSSFISVIKLKW